MGGQQLTTMSATLWWSSVVFVLIPAGLLFFFFLSLPLHFLSPIRRLTVSILDAAGFKGMNLATCVFFFCSLCVWWEYQVTQDKTMKMANEDHSHRHGAYWE